MLFSEYKERPKLRKKKWKSLRGFVEILYLQWVEVLNY